MKKIIITFLMICLCACSTSNNNQKDPSDDTPKSPFEEKNILAIECQKKDINYEAEYYLLRCSFKNNSKQDVVLDYIETLDGDGLYTSWYHPLRNKTIKSLETETFDFLNNGSNATSYSEIKEGQDLSNIVLSYLYYNPLDGVSNTINLADQSFVTDMYPLDNYYQSVDVDLLPMIPNFGYTLFAFKNNGTWSFDTVRGIEYEGCDSDYHHFMESISGYGERFYRDLFYKDDNYLVFSVTKEASVTEKEIKYFETIFNDLGLSYVYTDDIKGVSSAQNKYTKERGIELVPLGYTKEIDDKKLQCTETACLYIKENVRINTTKDYQFPSDYLDDVKENAYTIDEIVTFMEKNKSISFYMRGLDKALTLNDSKELDKLLNKKTRIDVDIQGAAPVFIGGSAKPVIYLYPETDMLVDVVLNYKGSLTSTYPKYNNGWKVLAKRDGILINQSDNKEYSYLFWEGIDNINYDMSKGFVVKREDTANFLQAKLAYLGLLPKEYNEFIVYWLPLLEKNAYNLISFQTDKYTDNAKLSITPKPDSMQRVFMTYKALDKEIEVEKQILEPFNRHGFSVIEWGGIQVYN